MAAGNEDLGETPRTGVSDRTPTEHAHAEAAVRTFLIVDVRGYTRFTQEQGDEEAGRLAGAFAALARQTVLSCGGELIELRGDEALCVFGSARQALRAAVELQSRFRQQTGEGPTFPLAIGIGLDAGEAVPIEGGYRGGALNTAARVCSLAGPGQILATDTVVSLARRLEGIRFRDRRPVRLKGLEKPVRVIEVVPEAGLPPLPVVASKKRAWATRRRLLVAGVAASAVAAAAIAFTLLRASGPEFLASVEPNAVAAIDAEAAGIQDQLTLDGRPGAFAAGGGSLWVADETAGTVSRVDRETRTIRSMAVGETADGLAYGAGALWATRGTERSVVRIAPDTGSILQTVAVGNGPGPVAVGGDAVWVGNTIDATVSRIDPDEGSVTDTVSIGSTPAAIGVGKDAVWVASEESGAVLRIDPRSREIVAAVNVGNGPTSIAVSGRDVWVANRQDGTVSRIDPATNSVSATIRVGTSPSAVAAGAGSVWIANSGDGTLARIDPETGGITGVLSLGSSPNAVAVADGKVWVTTLPSLADHRGGVLRIETEPSLCRCVDPAFGVAEIVNDTDISLSTLVYDGLVAYRRVNGIAGGRIVPNLAVRLPATTDEGKTYTFHLRPEIRFSNGDLVRASDFRKSLERTLTLNRDFALGFYDSIAGASACAAAEQRCDLSEGIEVDDTTGRITVRLTESDPNFLHKLTLPLAALVPAGTPDRAASTRPIPGTGAYQVSSFVPGDPENPDGEITLARNPHFRVWSADARPDGYPDTLLFHLTGDPEAGLAAVEAGEADWVSLLTLPSERQRALLTSSAGRVHRDLEPATFWMFLNARVPPFDDVRVRRAVNFAVDRDALLEEAGGAITGQATCQLLPPVVPGYRPYCPYTLNPNPAGTWVAPDLARARALVAESGTSGTRVEVVMLDIPVTVSVGRIFVSLLRELGYRSSLRTFEDAGEYFDYVADSRNRAQIGQAGWTANFLAAADFLEPFSCSRFLVGTPANENLSHYCNTRLDAEMRRAAALQASDPVRANELWAAIDRELVDEAVIVPLLNERNRTFVSNRVGNYQSHPQWGTLLDQLWVK